MRTTHAGQQPAAHGHRTRSEQHPPLVPHARPQSQVCGGLASRRDHAQAALNTFHLRRSTHSADPRPAHSRTAARKPIALEHQSRITGDQDPMQARARIARAERRLTKSLDIQRLQRLTLAPSVQERQQSKSFDSERCLQLCLLPYSVPPYKCRRAAYATGRGRCAS
jgi:hypothetical protein